MYRLKLLFTLLLVSLFIGFSSCSKKEESPEPVSKQNPQDPNSGGGNPPPPPPPPPDTLDMLTQSGWVINKVFLDNVEDPSSQALGHIYALSNTFNYTLTIPNVGSAGGTWSFAGSGKYMLNFMPAQGMGSPFQWQIVSLSNSQLVVNRLPVGNSQVRIEFIK